MGFFLVGVAQNRLVRLGEGGYQRIDSLTIPASGLMVHLIGGDDRQGLLPEIGFTDGVSLAVARDGRVNINSV